MAIKYNQTGSYYKSGDLECIDVIEGVLTKEEYEGFLKGQVLKYLFRMDKKDPVGSDSKKLKYYADRLALSQQKDG